MPPWPPLESNRMCIPQLPKCIRTAWQGCLGLRSWSTSYTNLSINLRLLADKFSLLQLKHILHNVLTASPGCCQECAIRH